MTEPPLILVADDDEDILSLLSLQLRRLGYRVLEAADGEEALERIAETEPALVLLDVMMPRLSGYDVLRKLRAAAATAELPVVLLSARAHPPVKAASLEAGADAYLTKPFAAEVLAKTIRGLLVRQARYR